MIPKHQTKLLYLSAILCAGFLATNVFASAEATEALIQLLDKTHTMQASFKQVTLDSKGKKVGRETAGNLVLQRPGKFRWEINKPNQQLIIVNNGRSVFYDVDLEQLTKTKVNYTQAGNPAVLLSGNAETLKKLFNITNFKKTGDASVFELRPKKHSESGGSYKSIKMHFNGEQLNTMTIISDFEQQTDIYLSNIKLNSIVAPKVFEFAPPRNVDVLET